MVMQLYYQMRKSMPIEKTKHVRRGVVKTIEQPKKVTPDTTYIVQLGGVFEEIGGADESVGGGNQKMGTANQQ